MIKHSVENIILNYRENTKIWIFVAFVFILVTHALFNSNYSLNELNKSNEDWSKFQNQSRELFDEYRKICLSKLKNQIIKAAESLSLRNTTALFVDLPDHMNYGIFLFLFFIRNNNKYSYFYSINLKVTH